MEYMSFWRFQQIKRYFHVLAPPTTSTHHLPIAHWYIKLEPLANLLRIKFKAYVVLG
jgi:hypothetical protein